MPKKYKNPEGEMLYIFPWVGGGGNHVHAPNAKVARKRATDFGLGIADRYGNPYGEQSSYRTTLVPDFRGMRSVNSFDEFLQFDRGLAMLAW